MLIRHQAYFNKRVLQNDDFKKTIKQMSLEANDSEYQILFENKRKQLCDYKVGNHASSSQAQSIYALNTIS